MRCGISNIDFHLRRRRISRLAVQGINLPVSRDRVACPFIAATNHHFVETFQPAKSVSTFQIDIGRIHHLFDRRIPPHSGTKAFDMQQIHPTRRAEGNCQTIFAADNNYLAAFLLATMQDFLLDAERLSLKLQLIAGNFPVSFLHAAFSACQHPGFSRSMSRYQYRKDRKSQFNLHI